MLIRKIVIGTIVLGITITGQLFAQSQPKSSKKNTGQDTSSFKDGGKPITVLLPDFLQYGLIKKGDTTFSYEYYDKNLHKINRFDLTNIDEADHVKFYKIFHGPSMPGNSVTSAPVEYILECQFAHPDPDLWLRYDHFTGKIIRYKIYKNEIVSRDSATITDPITKNQRNFIYKYFKTEIISKDSVQAHEH